MEISPSVYKRMVDVWRTLLGPLTSSSHSLGAPNGIPTWVIRQKFPYVSWEQGGLMFLFWFFFFATINQVWNSWKTCRKYFGPITPGLRQKNAAQKGKKMRWVSQYLFSAFFVVYFWVDSIAYVSSANSWVYLHWKSLEIFSRSRSLCEPAVSLALKDLRGISHFSLSWLTQGAVGVKPSPPCRWLTSPAAKLFSKHHKWEMLRRPSSRTAQPALCLAVNRVILANRFLEQNSISRKSKHCQLSAGLWAQGSKLRPLCILGLSPWAGGWMRCLQRSLPNSTLCSVLGLLKSWCFNRRCQHSLAHIKKSSVIKKSGEAKDQGKVLEQVMSINS